MKIEGGELLSERNERRADGVVSAAPTEAAKGASRPAPKQKPRRKRSFPRPNIPLPLWLGALILILAIALCFALKAMNRVSVPKGELQVHFIDVGQGDAALLVTSDAAILIDAGTTEARFATADFVADHAEALDLMILTHPHEDHVGGAARIMDFVPTAKVVMPDLTSTAGAFVRTLDAIEAHGVEAALASAGDVFEVGDLRLTVLAPLTTEHEDLNDSSLVLRVDFGESSFLFTGDAGEESEREMLGAYPITSLDCDVLKLGHHGSSGSSTPEFLDAVRPQIAVISVGRGNDYGHPARDTLDRLAACGVRDIYRTDELGTVTLVSDGRTVRLEDD